MSVKTIAAPLSSFAEAPLAGVPPFFRSLRSVAHWLLRRFTPTASSAPRVLAVEDRVTIGPKKSLVVVRCHGRRFLIATCGDTIGPVIEVTPALSPHRNRREREA